MNFYCTAEHCSCIQEYNDGTIGGLSLDDVLDYIDTAPTIEVKGNG